MGDFIQNTRDFLPELILLLFSVLSLIVGVNGGTKARNSANKVVGAGLFAAFIATAGVQEGDKAFLDGDMIVWTKLVLLTGAAVVLAFGTDWLKYKKYRRFEYASLLGFSVSGMMMTVTARDFLVQFLGLETMFFPMLFLTAYKRQGERSTQAGTKFGVTMLLASGLYLFGVSVLYACTGTVDFDKTAMMDKAAILPALLWGLSFVVAGLFLRIGAVPFHSWMADVYEGAASPVTAVFATIVRLPVIVALAKIVFIPFAGFDFYWRPVLGAVAVLSILVGGFGAVVQTNIKRLTAYTVLAFNGFALAAAVTGNARLLFDGLLADWALSAGLVAILLSLRVGDELMEELRVLSGQGQAKPVRGALFALIFAGLAGVPPFALFGARFSLMRALVEMSGTLAVLSALGGLLMTYVYLKLIRQMYLTTAKEELEPASFPMKTVIVASAAFSALWFVITI